MCRSTGCHAGTKLLFGKDFPALALSDALFQTGYELGAAGGEVFALGLDELEALGYEVVEVTIATCGELLLEGASVAGSRIRLMGEVYGGGGLEEKFG